jgi:NADH:ubiquinone oxidoreductase subunit 3 (subunit A)
MPQPSSSPIPPEYEFKELPLRQHFKLLLLLLLFVSFLEPITVILLPWRKTFEESAVGIETGYGVDDRGVGV